MKKESKDIRSIITKKMIEDALFKLLPLSKASAPKNF